MLTVRLDYVDEAELDRIAKMEGVTKSGFVRQLVKDAINARRETPFEAASRLGLIGCIDGHPDLAQNHRSHIMEKLNAKHSG
jgi:metal-responsive CopG/Arc/MetJ family transcriptional regulator